MFEATGSTLYEKNVSSDVDFGSAECVVKTTIKANTSKNDLALPFIENIQTNIIRRFEFSSKLQRMSALVKTSLDSGFFRLHIKGAPEKIRELCVEDSIPDNYQETLSKYTNRGFRVLACASRILKISEHEAATLERVDLEKDFAFIGFLILENKMKEITPSIIEKLHEALIRPVMVTGDNALTAISIARQCEIINPSYRVLLGTLQDDPLMSNKKRIEFEDLEFPNDKLDDSLRLEHLDSDDEEDGHHHQFLNEPQHENRTLSLMIQRGKTRSSSLFTFKRLLRT